MAQGSAEDTPISAGEVFSLKERALHRNAEPRVRKMCKGNEDERLCDEQGEEYPTTALSGDLDHYGWSKAGSDGGQTNRSVITYFKTVL